MWKPSGPQKGNKPGFFPGLCYEECTRPNKSCESTSSTQACLLISVSSCCRHILVSPSGESSRSSFSQTGAGGGFCNEAPVPCRNGSRCDSHLPADLPQELLANFQSQPSGQRLGFRPQCSNTAIKLFLLQMLAQWKKCTLLPVHTCISFETEIRSLFKDRYTHICKKQQEKILLKGKIYFCNSIFKFSQQKSIVLW